MAPARAQRRWTTKLVVAFGIVLAGLMGAAVAWALFSNISTPGTDNASAAAVDHITISPSPSSITAGGSQPYTVTAYDSSDNSFGDVTSNPSTSFSMSPDGSCNGNSCTATASGPHTVTAHFWGLTTTASLTVNSSTLDHFALSIGTPQTDGVAFTGTNSLTAQDVYNNTISGFNAATDNVTVTAGSPLTAAGVSFTSGATGNVLNTAGDFSSGVANLTSLGMTYTGTAGTGTFTATSATNKAGASANVVINVGGLDHFVLAAATPQTDGVVFTGTNSLTAKDVGNNTISGFNAANDNVTVTAGSPLTAAGVSFTSGATGNVLNTAGDFSSGVANLTSLGMTYTGTAGTGTFTATSATNKTGTSANVTVSYATSGSGTMGVSPSTATASSTGNNLTFTFTAPSSSGSFGPGSAVTLAIPSGTGTTWTVPQTTNSGNAGYTTTTAGTCTPGTLSVSSSLITVPMACAAGTSFTINYANAIAQTNTGTATFTTQTKEGAGGTLTNISTQPTVTVTVTGALGFVQAEEFSCSSSTTACVKGSTQFTLATPTTAGDLIVVSVMDKDVASAAVSPTVKDSASNSYTATTENPATGYWESTAYVLNAASASSITIKTNSNSGLGNEADDLAVTVAEFAGYTSVDKSSANDGTSSGNFDSGTAISTTNAHDLLVGTVGSQNVSTFSITSSGYTNTTLETASALSEQLAYRAVTGTGSYSFAGSGAGSDWGAQVYAFKGP